jgi:multidrug transporter EmrE-like cation transporter
MTNRVARPEALRAAGFLLIAVVAQAIGNVCLSIGMKSLGALSEAHPGDWTLIGLTALQSPYVVIGVAMLVVFFVLFAHLLSHLDLTIAMPVVSLEVVLNVACGHWLLGETVTPLRWLGAVLVAVGVALVGMSARGGARVP